MRVASPFNDFAKDSLNLYRVIDPDIWARLVGRVKGANFGAIYGKTKAMAYHSLTLPKGHTWESYTKFLLDTLPARLRNNYIKKFQTSIEFWHSYQTQWCVQLYGDEKFAHYILRQHSG